MADFSKSCLQKADSRRSLPNNATNASIFSLSTSKRRENSSMLELNYKSVCLTLTTPVMPLAFKSGCFEDSYHAPSVPWEAEPRDWG